MSDRKKPRFPRINIDFGREAVITGMNDTPEGVLQLFGQDGAQTRPAECYVDMIYERDGKSPKTVSRIWVDPEEIHQEPIRALLRYDHLFAVDTNTAPGDVGIASMLWLSDLKYDEPRWDAKLRQQLALEFHGAKTTHERVGWWLMVGAIVNSPEVPMGGRIGVIVDHDMNSIQAINKREQPVIGSALLPDGIEFIYATADKSDFLCNQLIRRCDRHANAVKRRIADGEQTGPLAVVEGQPFEQVRQWPCTLE